MMRRLGDLWKTGNPSEKEFVRLLLEALAHDGLVWDKTWREGQELWEQAVQLQIDLGKQCPELEAQIALTILMTAESDLERLGPIRNP